MDVFLHGTQYSKSDPILYNPMTVSDVTYLSKSVYNTSSMGFFMYGKETSTYFWVFWRTEKLEGRGARECWAEKKQQSVGLQVVDQVGYSKIFQNKFAYISQICLCLWVVPISYFKHDWTVTTFLIPLSNTVLLYSHKSNHCLSFISSASLRYNI